MFNFCFLFCFLLKNSFLARVSFRIWSFVTARVARFLGFSDSHLLISGVTTEEFELGRLKFEIF